MGKKKAWQINVIPTMNWILTDNGYSNIPTGQPRFDSQRGWVALQVGVTYKFKNRNGSHNFKYSNRVYTQDELDVYIKDNDVLKNGLNRSRDYAEKLKKDNAHLAQLVNNLTEENKRLVNENNSLKNAVHPVVNVVGFELGKDVILESHRPSILNIAYGLRKNTNTKVVITGYADANTGSDKRNMELSVARAEAVRKELIELGIDANRIVVEGKGASVQPYDENNANRVVVSVVSE
jgi:outer membrane protein OmpA-like peptidoglycan-associated protein